MKKIFCSFLIGLVVLFSFPFSCFAYTIVPSENVIYYKDDLLDVSSIYLNAMQNDYNIFFVFANSTYYLFVYDGVYPTDVHSGDIVANGNLNTLNFRYKFSHLVNIYTWQSGDSSYQTTTLSNNYPDTQYTGDWALLAASFKAHRNDDSYINVLNNYGTDFTINNVSYPFYFDSTGRITYEGDPGSGGGESGEGGTVDLTTTNSLLSAISDSADDIAADIADIKTALGSLTTINTNVSDIKTSLAGFRSDVSTALGNINASIATAATSIVNAVSNGFSGLQTYLTGKYETLYNVILYGNKEGTIEEDSYDNLEAMEKDLDTLSQDMSDAAGLLHGANVNIAAYVTTFSEFYNGLGALGYGISGILTFGLFIILVKKVVGR